MYIQEFGCYPNSEERKASEGLSVVDELWMRQDWRQGELFRGC